ncbi:HAD family hydrolase [Exilibacterium tricleocarpae]|uniref:HAD family hydrolase n=1 Tax=Exilibacterium tricleocarpae TaxID=2591008 RepID=A0A545T0M2_9GAMM|nr:HAD family hydrolase [Exilibacterium tricleocarpae]TQV70765.1 HAD family hydrolase [Exilibacterium tricleocarpae]
MTAVKLITFDLDNTLWHVDEVLRKAEQAVYGWLQHHCPTLTGAYSAEALFEARVAYWKQHPEFKHQISIMRRSSLAHLLEGCGYSAAEARQHSDEAFELFMDFRHRVTFFDHALGVVEQLGRHYQLGILSNGNACPRRLGIDNYFDFHYSAEALNASKPSPVPFTTALEHVQVEARQCIHIGDSPRDDILGAAALGIQTIWVNREGEPWRESSCRPDAEVACLSEIPQAVADIEQRLSRRHGAGT